MKEHVFPADDATELFVREYRPRDSDAARTLVLLHGLLEHGGRYDHVAQSFVASGWRAVVPDLRGHGRSGGIAAHADHFGRYLRDLDRLWERFQLRPESTAILGHSLGGLITVRRLQQNTTCAAAAVLVSPLLAVKRPVPRLLDAMGRVCSLVLPRLRFDARVDPSDTTRNREILAKRREDPLIHSTVTARWYVAMRKAVRRAWMEVDRIDGPLLVCQAGDDRLVDARAAAAWVERVASIDKTFRQYPERYHELLNEPDWKTTLGEIIDWLDTRVTGVSGGTLQPAHRQGV